MDVQPHQWPPPSGLPFEIPRARHRSRVRWALLVAAIVMSAVTVGVVAAASRQSGSVPNANNAGAPVADFAVLAEAADCTYPEAKSIYVTHTTTSAGNWTREELRIDRDSGRMATSVWQHAEPQPTSTASTVDLVFDAASRYIHAHRFDDPGRSDETWFLMEGKGGLDAADIDDKFTIVCGVLANVPDGQPFSSTQEELAGESLTRFETFVPAADLLHSLDSELVGYPNLDPAAGATYSIWFGASGECRRILIDAQANTGSWSFDISSEVSDQPVQVEIPDPSDVSSWREFKEASND